MSGLSVVAALLALMLRRMSGPQIAKRPAQ